MTEITIKVDVPHELKKEFEMALARAIKNFERDLEFAIADAITSKSKLTEEQLENLADELKKRVAMRHSS
jgi:hypothetical protein